MKTKNVLFLFLLTFELQCIGSSSIVIGNFSEINIRKKEKASPEETQKKVKGEFCNWSETATISKAFLEIQKREKELLGLRDVQVNYRRKLIFFFPFPPFPGAFLDCFEVIGVPVYKTGAQTSNSSALLLQNKFIQRIRSA